MDQNTHYPGGYEQFMKARLAAETRTRTNGGQVIDEKQEGIKDSSAAEVLENEGAIDIAGDTVDDPVPFDGLPNDIEDGGNDSFSPVAASSVSFTSALVLSPSPALPIPGLSGGDCWIDFYDLWTLQCDGVYYHYSAFYEAWVDYNSNCAMTLDGGYELSFTLRCEGDCGGEILNSLNPANKTPIRLNCEEHEEDDDDPVDDEPPPPPLVTLCVSETIGVGGVVGCSVSPTGVNVPLVTINGMDIDTVKWDYEAVTNPGVRTPVGGSPGPVGTASLRYAPTASGVLYVTAASANGTTLWTDQVSITIDTNMPCDRFTPSCWQQPTAQDSVVIRAALDTANLNILANITDTTERRVCGALFAILKLKWEQGDSDYRNLAGNGGIFRGNTAVPDSLKDIHDGQAWGVSFHIDGDWLDSARVNPTLYTPKHVLSLMLHEAAHTWYPNGITEDTGIPSHPRIGPATVHTTAPWKYFENSLSTATSGCVRS